MSCTVVVVCLLYVDIAALLTGWRLLCALWWILLVGYVCALLLLVMLDWILLLQYIWIVEFDMLAGAVASPFVCGSYSAVLR